ncbi:MAG: chemoreceptor glutamine deamidase CheD [Oleispira antarctica]|uniref:Probable chemoreceptor glutamine deamidase CheD n=1 Tax=Oleispira antarctica RB-8 TaxID=698738 RepID=R4YLI4_OLEAN|nr:chemoreceptor glutamine deamidase CheD [Oleispira antarctica]MBQ0792538.1 chemoreceptor glutamine deamidase CheD [Oleispira antarctica]CCK75400.1 CheD chemotaxis protein [Oleispira antarctica RB-8]
MTALNNNVSQPEQPPLSQDFTHINRYWDNLHQVWAAKILPGELYVSTHGEMISTVLGSCISVCIRDKKKGIGGMNHFMLPQNNEFSSESWGTNPITSASRYGNWAMEYLINAILKCGGEKKNFEVKVFGGGQMMARMTDIGQKNILFVYQYLAEEKLRIEASDVGDIYARKVLYFPDTGCVKVRRIKHIKNDTIIRRETEYEQHVKVVDEAKPDASNVELF